LQPFWIVQKKYMNPTIHRYSLLLVFLAFAGGIFAQDNFQIIKSADTLQYCAGDQVNLTVIGTSEVDWQPENILISATGLSAAFLPTGSVWIFASTTIDDETLIDSIFLEQIDLQISASWAGQIDPICEGTPIEVTASFSGPSGTILNWRAAGNLETSDNPAQLSAPRGGQVIGQVSFGNCTVSDTLQLEVIDFGVPSLVTLDTLVCQGQVFRLASDPGPSSTVYSWSPDVFLNDPTIANPRFTAGDQDVTYIFRIESEDGTCKDSFEIDIRVIPIKLTLNVEDTTLMCLGDTLNIIASVNGDPSEFSWSPDDEALSSLTDLRIQAYPEFSNFYFARYELNGCVVIDTFFLKVDSLPVNTSINVVPLEDDYCPGEELSLFSGMYNGLLFPDIQFGWVPRDNSLRSQPDGYNLFISTTVTNTYIRTITNGGCTRMDSIEIIVKQPEIELNLTDTIVCPGQSVQIRILNEVTDISWTPETWLSCSDCTNPVSTPLQTIVYTVSGKNQDCPTSASVRISVFPLPNIGISLDPAGEKYIGDSLNFVIVSFPPLPDDSQFSWTFNGDNRGQRDGTLLAFADRPTNTVTATYITENGCVVSTSLNVTAREPEYEIPNAFTPNNDMVNDLFRAVLKGAVEVVDMRIFSRWGQVVYQATNNEGWDGNFRGEPSPPDVYAYRFIFRLPNGRTFEERGDVTLLR
jgi:gliding motility-associated-like protein